MSILLLSSKIFKLHSIFKEKQKFVFHGLTLTTPTERCDIHG